MPKDAHRFPPSTVATSETADKTAAALSSSETSVFAPTRKIAGHNSQSRGNNNTVTPPSLISRVLGRFSSWGSSRGSASDNVVPASVSNLVAHDSWTSGALKDLPRAASGQSTSSGETLPARTETEEPKYLARKIQDLIGALVFPSSGVSSSVQPQPPQSPECHQSPRPPVGDLDITPKTSSQPFPVPLDATPVLRPLPLEDAHLIAMLSSPVIMSGNAQLEDGEERGGRRRSVWSVLDSMASPRSMDGAKTLQGDDDDDRGSMFSDGSSVMMYSPLLPTTASLVELAESEVILPVAPFSPQAAGEVETHDGQGTGWVGTLWPFSSWGGGGLESGLGSGGPGSGSGGIGGLDQHASQKRSSTPPRMAGQRVWVPSTSKLSLQAMWWGYRLYLPPPVLEILDDRQIEATKRAAVITAALTWFFGNLPVNVLPVAVRPAVMLFQTIIPYVGYIGTFISWSWGTVKSYDAGYGVVLTATWLLPVALIPSTWHEEDFPPPSPGPLRPQSLGPGGSILPKGDIQVQTIRTPASPLSPMTVRFQPMALPTPASTPTPRGGMLPPHSPPPQYAYSPPSLSPLQSPAFLSPLAYSPSSNLHLQSLTTPLLPSSPSPLTSPFSGRWAAMRADRRVVAEPEIGGGEERPSRFVFVVGDPYMYWPPMTTDPTDPPQPFFLPSWVPPPPPPSPGTIPLPEVGVELSQEEGQGSYQAPPSHSVPASTPRIVLSPLASSPTGSSSSPLSSVRTIVRRTNKKERGREGGGGTEPDTSTVQQIREEHGHDDKRDGESSRRRTMKLKLKAPSMFWKASSASSSSVAASPASSKSPAVSVMSVT